MGQVYRASDERLSREVALKVVHADSRRRTSSGSSRFEHEAKAAGVAQPSQHRRRLRHRQHETAAPYIVSELLAGRDAARSPGDGRSRHAQGDRLRRPDRARSGRRAREGHRPPRPEAREPVPHQGRARQDPRLRDRQAGAAGRRARRHRRRRPSRTPARARGPCWAPSATCRPSRCGASPTDHRSDLFSFGAVLFEMLTGRRAFKGATAADTLSAILREDPTEALGTRVQRCPPGCCASCVAVSRSLPRIASRPRATSPLPSRARRPSRRGACRRRLATGRERRRRTGRCWSPALGLLPLGGTGLLAGSRAQPRRRRRPRTSG